MIHPASVALHYCYGDGALVWEQKSMGELLLEAE